MKQRKHRGNLRKRDAATAGAGAGHEGAAAAAADGGGGGGAPAAAAEDDDTAVVRKAKQARGEPLLFSTKRDGPGDVAVTYASTAEALSAKDTSATRALQTETEFDRDAR
jgi:RING finger protein 113A